MSRPQVEGPRLGQLTEPDRPTGGGAWSASLLASRLAPAGIVIVAIAIQALRLRAALGRSLWAEDGQIFLGDALHLSLAQAIGHPYAGYMHLVPRLIAWLAAALPLHLAPWVMSAGALLVVGLVSLFVFTASATLIRSVPIRLTLALLVPLLPAGQEEVFGVVANIHWFLNIAAFWALVWKPATGRRTALAALVVAVAVLCDPLAVLLLPVALLRGYVLGWRTVRWQAGILVLAGVVQAVAVMNGRGQRPFSAHASVPEVLAQYWVGVLGRALGGGLYVLRVDARGVLFALVATVLLAGLLMRAWQVLGDAVPLAAAAGIAAAGFPLFAVVTYLSGVAPQRYAVLSIFLVYVAVAYLLDQMLRADDRAAGWVTLGAGVLIAVVAVANAAITTPLTTAVPWTSQLESTAPACATERASVRVATSPDGWYVGLSCHQLLAAMTDRP